MEISGWIETQGEPRVFFMEGMCALTRVRWLFAPTLGFSGPAVPFVPPFPGPASVDTWPDSSIAGNGIGTQLPLSVAWALPQWATLPLT
jgi:hypothetical protein